LALIHYSEWVHHILEDGIYTDFFEEGLPKPEVNENLGNFINRLAQISHEVNMANLVQAKKERKKEKPLSLNFEHRRFAVHSKHS
jgi:hypothetical protein